MSTERMSWTAATHTILSELEWFATWRDAGLSVEQAAAQTDITTATARRYERALDTLITALHSKTAPAGDAAGADTTPPQGGINP